jgi:hypothetical protein
MKFLNGWASPNKQWDKWEFRLRLGAIDVLRFKYDHSDKYFEFRILNLGGKAGGRKRK